MSFSDNLQVFIRVALYTSRSMLSKYFKDKSDVSFEEIANKLRISAFYNRDTNEFLDKCMNVIMNEVSNHNSELKSEIETLKKLNSLKENKNERLMTKLLKLREKLNSEKELREKLNKITEERDAIKSAYQNLMNENTKLSKDFIKANNENNSQRELISNLRMKYSKVKLENESLKKTLCELKVASEKDSKLNYERDLKKLKEELREELKEELSEEYEEKVSKADSENQSLKQTIESQKEYISKILSGNNRRYSTKQMSELVIIADMLFKSINESLSEIVDPSDINEVIDYELINIINKQRDDIEKLEAALENKIESEA